MKIENGKVIFEVIPCDVCSGTGKQKERVVCPNNNKPHMASKRKPCTICGNVSRWNHKAIETGKIIDCWHCSGKGIYQEKSTDYCPENLFNNNTTFYVIRQNEREMSWGEQHVGLMGSVFSCVDYGRNHTQSDEELIESVKDTIKVEQASKFIDEENNVLPILIITGDQGYTVTKLSPKYKEKFKLYLERRNNLSNAQ